MNRKKAAVILSVNTLICTLMIAGMAIFMGQWGWLMQALFYLIAGVGLVAGFILFFLKKDMLLKSLFVLEIFIALTLVPIILTNELANLDQYVTDTEKVKYIVQLIQNTSGWGKFIFVLIQIFLVLFSPIPAWIFFVAGAQIWGPGITTLLGSLGVFIGSMIAYYLGRIFGQRIAIWIAGEETVKKYTSILAHKGKAAFLMMQILPLFPDDILCVLAGMTKMNPIYFIVVMLTVRPAIVAMYSYGGSGQLIPFSGWGIPVWIALFAICGTLLVLYWKYQDRIESWIMRKVFRRTERSKTPENTVNTNEINLQKDKELKTDGQTAHRRVPVSKPRINNKERRDG